MDRKLKKALAMGVVAFFVTRDFKVVLVIGGSSYVVDAIVENI